MKTFVFPGQGSQSKGMAAVIGLQEKQIEKIILEKDFKTIEIANYNSPSQIVISGHKDEIIKAQAFFENAGAKLYIPLKVSGAFHSSHMKEASLEFKSYLDSFDFKVPKIPVISNVTARPYKENEIRKNLYQQMTNSVKWSESIRYLMGKGSTEFEEVGPGDVLKGLISRIGKEAKPLVIKKDEVNDDLKRRAIYDSCTLDEMTNEKVSNWNNLNQESDIVLCNANQSESSVSSMQITAESLGAKEYKDEYNLRYAYCAGAMYRGIASKEIVIAMAKSGMLGFLGTGGMSVDEISQSLEYIQNQLSNNETFGVNLLSNPIHPHKEEEQVDLFIESGVNVLEAAAFMQMTPALVKYRLLGLEKTGDRIIIKNRIQAKVSRPEVAELFLSPAPERIVSKLLEENKITQEQADIAKQIPMADDICVEADSGGHTDMGVAYALMPAMQKVRDDMMNKFNYNKRVRVGAAEGIGTPESAAAAFMLGADFIVTGSINQCTVEAGTSDLVKDLLQQANVQDTEYAPAGDMFEMGAKVQVLKKGLFFPARANKLFDLYQRYNSIDEIDDKTKKQIQDKYFKRSFEEIYADTKNFFKDMPGEIEKAEKNQKHKMALIFRWYFGYSTNLALKGESNNRVDFQIHCGPAMGAFNQWVKGTELENWKNRHVDVLALKIMNETASFLNNKITDFMK